MRPVATVPILMDMDPLTLTDLGDLGFSLRLECGSTPVDDAINAEGHEPNGYFWQGVAEVVCASRAPQLVEQVEFDPEGSAFFAYASDPDPLRELGELLAEVANDSSVLASVIADARGRGFEFDD